ncbi:MAG: hypothetical protein M1370_00685 [Bacteroidetes bacterium]|nr:hypothetical protein [Bacteroidota bacterium]MCL5027292.1 hypothetical protein [Chloroflexota bacterium]
MKIKKYYAPSPGEALKEIRAQLGEDAVILHSKRVAPKGLLGLLKGPGYEITAAVDAPDDAVPAKGRNALGPVQGAAGAYWPDTSLQTAELDDMKVSIRQMQETISRLDTSHRKNGKHGGHNELPPQLLRLGNLFASQGIEEQLSQDIIKQITFELSREAVQDWEIVREAAARQVERRFATVDPIGSVGPADPVGSNDGRVGPTVILVVGPTGVGKTTTIAKLGAMLSIEGHTSVSIVTTDTIRVGAIPQLGAYADIFGIPFEVAYSPADLARCAGMQAGRHVMLVDTPGWSARTANTLRLPELVGAVDRCIVLLTLSSTEKIEVSLRALRELNGVPVYGLVITKLDETGDCGSVLNLAYRSGLPTAYITSGQNVPDDIELANYRALALRFLGTSV